MPNCIKCNLTIDQSCAFCPHCGKKQIKNQKTVRKRRDNQQGSISRLSGNRKKPFLARITENQRHVNIGTFKTEQDAEDALAEWRKLNISAERYNLTLGDLYNQLLNETTVGESGLEHYKSSWIRLKELEHRLARELVTDDFTSIIVNAKKVPRYKQLTPQEIKKLSTAERKKYNALVSKPLEPLGRDGKLQIKNLASILCKSAMAKKLMDKNYAELVKIDSEEKKQKRNLSKSDIDVLFNNHNNECVMIILMYLYSGFRANELLQMKKAEVNTTNWFFIGGSKTQAGRNRLVPILDCIRPYVEHFMEKDGAYFITNQKGQPIRYRYFLESMFYPTLDSLNIKRMNEEGSNILTPHRTRHTIAQLAVAAKVSPEALKQILGHAKYTTTIDFYAEEASPEYLIQEFSKVETPKQKGG